MKPRIGLFLGDPCGIGPEIVAKLMQMPKTHEQANVVLIGDHRIYEMGARAANVSIDVPVVDALDAAALLQDGPLLLDVPIPDFERIVVGEESAIAGRSVIFTLARALHLAHSGQLDALLFAPLNKHAMHLGGLEFEDELRFFAHELGCESYVGELNVLDGLWTSRVTSHVPLRAVADLITVESVSNAVRLLHSALRRAGVETPRIGVPGLNPHAGDGGSFGMEEIEIIGPAIAQLRQQGLNVDGPLSPDIAFLKARDGDYDGIVTMYHEQGQIAMKLMGFEKGVTVHGGLPFPVATPAHGTAFDIAGKGVARTQALENAFALTCAIVKAA